MTANIEQQLVIIQIDWCYCLFCLEQVDRANPKLVTPTPAVEDWLNSVCNGWDWQWVWHTGSLSNQLGPGHCVLVIPADCEVLFRLRWL